MDLAQHYRLIDAPLTRYMLGLARALSGQNGIRSDWNWTLTWQENQAAGALPDDRLLHFGRFLLALLFPLDLILINSIGKRLHSQAAGILAMVFFGLNALVLLHTRRAMTEAILTFGVLAATWSFLEAGRRPWLAGLALGFAVCAKHTAIALLPVGLFAAALPAALSDSTQEKLTPPQAFGNWAQMIAVFTLVVLSLNPVFWREPIRSAHAAWEERLDLLDRMKADHQVDAGESFGEDYSRRLAGTIAHLFMTPPSFAETDNYSDQIMPLELAYLNVPGHQLVRGLAMGGMMFATALAGMTLAVMEIRKVETNQRRAILILLAVTFALGAGVIILAQLPWQRYVVPLVPLVCLWQAYLAAALGTGVACRFTACSKRT